MNNAVQAERAGINLKPSGKTSRPSDEPALQSSKARADLIRLGAKLCSNHAQSSEELPAGTHPSEPIEMVPQKGVGSPFGILKSVSINVDKDSRPLFWAKRV